RSTAWTISRPRSSARSAPRSRSGRPSSRSSNPLGVQSGAQSGGAHGVRGPIRMDARLMRETTTDEALVEAHVAPARTRHIAIDVRVDGDVISGHAGDGTGRPRQFRGWLGLLGALDRLLANPAIDESH